VEDITVSGVQGAALLKPERDRVWEGKRISITKGPLKGYHGLVKAEDHSGVDVELDAKLTMQGQRRQRVKLGDFQPELE
jgi:transcription elongation factor